MGLLIAGAVGVTIYVAERLATLRRRATLERRRANAEYPTTENDPIGRTIA